MLRGQRLLVEHIENGASDVVALERAHQRPVVDDGSTRDVHEPGARSHRAELALTDHPARLGSERDGEDDEVGLA